MKKPKYTGWIEQYLDGELIPEEMERFESELTTNPDLREEYDLFNALEEHFRIEAAMEEMFSDPVQAEKVREITDRWFEEEAEGSRQSAVGSTQSAVGSRQSAVDTGQLRKDRIRKIGWIAGIAAGLAIVLSIFFSRNMRPDTRELFAEYVEEVTSMELSDESMPEVVYAGIFTGIEQYEAQEYADAIRTFMGLEPWKEAYPEISLFKGLVFLEVGENEIALSAFKECAQHRGPYRKYARWFRNMAYIRLIHPDVAIMFIIERTNFYHSLGEGTRNVIRHANLIATLQFKELRREMNPDMVGKPLIIHADDVFFFILFLLVLVVIPLILLRDILIHRFEKPWKALFILLVVFMPIAGPIAYAGLRKEKIIKSNSQKGPER